MTKTAKADIALPVLRQLDFWRSRRKESAKYGGETYFVIIHKVRIMKSTNFFFVEPIFKKAKKQFLEEESSECAQSTLFVAT